jgi:RNA polymerase sigma-70 factor (ECF subfamily)
VHKDDSTLVAEVRNGSQASFEQLMERYQRQVYRLAYSYAKSLEHAMDITQNVFIKTYQNLHKFRGDSQFKTWLLRITCNESQNWLKKNLRYKSEENLETLLNENATALNQEDELLAKENRTLLLQSLYELNTRHRLAVVLRYFENYSIREISEILHCSEGLVKNILFRSLQKMKNNLKPIFHGEIQ